MALFQRGIHFGSGAWGAFLAACMWHRRDYHDMAESDFTDIDL
jgi:hypothetical protein